MKEAVKHTEWPCRQNCLICGRIMLIIAGWRFKLIDKVFEITIICRWCRVCRRPHSKFELVFLFQSAIGDFNLQKVGLWSDRVNGFFSGGSLTIGRISFGLIEKKSWTVHELSLETCRHPCRKHSSLVGNKWLISQVFVKELTPNGTHFKNLNSTDFG